MTGVQTCALPISFTTIPFVRTSRTNDKGEFTIRNMAPGTYRIYALEDVMRSYKYSQPGQQIAFYDSLIVPAFELTTRQDTIWKDSLTIDTVMTVGYTHFMPDNIELRLFKEKVERQYMLKPERTDEKILTLRFNTSLDTIPVPVPLNFTPADSNWYFLQTAEEGKAVHYWLTDSLIWKQDTLQVEVNYLKSDSMNILRPQTDTVQFTVRRRPVEKKKKKKDDEPEPIEFLGMNVNASGSINLYDTVAVTFSEPVAGLTKDHFYLDQKVDTLWQDIPFEFGRDSLNQKKFNLYYDWEPTFEYEFEVDSTAFHGIYGLFTDKIKQGFKVRSEDEYFTLHFNVTGADSLAFVELLDAQDKVVRKRRVEKDGMVDFYFLNPGKYAARLINDTNGNGEWDTGDFAKGLQPEAVFYYPTILEYKALWDVTQPWDIHATPVDKQKPDELKKQKPDEDKKKKDRNNQNRRR